MQGTRRIGTMDTGYSTLAIVTVEGSIETTPQGNERLSISAYAERPGAPDIDQGGQMIDAVENDLHDRIISTEDLAELVSIWRRWHLNDMRAGCEHQREEGWDERPIDPTKPTNTYGRHFEGQQQDSWNLLGWVRPDEHPDGLLTKPCPVCGYKYGSAWLTEDLPESVREWFERFFSVRVAAV